MHRFHLPSQGKTHDEDAEWLATTIAAKFGAKLGRSGRACGFMGYAPTGGLASFAFGATEDRTAYFMNVFIELPPGFLAWFRGSICPAVTLHCTCDSGG